MESIILRTMAAEVVTSSAWPPKWQSAQTQSPTLKPVTPAPSDSTVPATS